MSVFSVPQIGKGIIAWRRGRRLQRDEQHRFLVVFPFRSENRAGIVIPSPGNEERQWGQCGPEEPQRYDASVDLLR